MRIIKGNFENLGYDRSDRAYQIKSLSNEVNVSMRFKANSTEQIIQFFDPMIELSNVDIHPVLSLQEALEQLKN